MNWLEAERLVSRRLRDLNFLTGSLRRVKGPGDLIAIPLSYHKDRPLLVEVKATIDIPWSSGDNFGPVNRGGLLLAADVWDCEPMLAWVPPMPRGFAKSIFWLPEEDWPLDPATVGMAKTGMAPL